ncbi:RHS repeat-associated core domain-containing protein [Pseudoalteromonas spongiae]|uniref:RHS repeat-associated core domain-containing protein n=1 Tax=Pseudoalteromonas spongiae TaxID=298657 RepID=UPI000C2D68A3|nr:RHS repeat-associated core domain-containing protein [Pseudoalteromonas spongiae]
MIAETYSLGSRLKTYLYGDDLISQTDSNSTTNTFHYDGLGSTRSLSNDSGEQSDSYDYLAFGELQNQTGTTENNYLYTGEQFDGDLDQYYLRARYYDQNVGRFTHQDAWMGRDGEPVTLNKYLYTHADPVNGVDPSGYMTLGNVMPISSGMMILSSTTIPSYSGFLAKTAVGLLTAGLLIESAYEDDANVVKVLDYAVSKELLKSHRIELEKVIANAISKSRARGVVYHYTDRPGLVGIVGCSCINSSKGYSHPDGIYRPEGVYGTLIPPFADTTQKVLKQILYARPRNRQVTHFVAVDNDSRWDHRTLGAESVIRAPRGQKFQ